MGSNDFVQTGYMAEAIRCLAKRLEEDPDVLIPSGISIVLYSFTDSTRQKQLFQCAGELANSLAGLLINQEEKKLNEQMNRQVRLLISSILEQIDKQGKSGSPVVRSPMVTPIAPSQQNDNRHVALYLANDPLFIILDQSLTQENFLVSRIESPCGLAKLDEDEPPVAIITDLDLYKLTPDAAQEFKGIRERFTPPIHLFCLADVTNIDARLEAVRLGATRFFGKQPDMKRLIAVLNGVTAPVKPFRVLLVDDDPLSCALHEKSLRKAGIETSVISEPLLVPALIEQFKPDVVLSDIYMPGCNGLELLALLRQDERLANTPIIFLTSETDTNRRLEALNLGADEFLNKPVHHPTLVATIKARAKRSRALKRADAEHRWMIEQLRQLKPLPLDNQEWPDTRDIFLEEYFVEDDLP